MLRETETIKTEAKSNSHILKKEKPCVPLLLGVYSQFPRTSRGRRSLIELEIFNLKSWQDLTLPALHDHSQTVCNERKWLQRDKIGLQWGGRKGGREEEEEKKRRRNPRLATSVGQEEGKVESFVKAKENRGKWWETEGDLLFACPWTIRGTRLLS